MEFSLASRVREDARVILRLAGPLLVNNVATAGMGFTDTVMAGRLGAPDLAAVAIGASFVSFFYLGGLGVLMAMSPTVAHAYGAGRDELVGRFFRQALWLSAAVSAIATGGLLAAHPLLLAIGIPPRTAATAASYCHAVAAGVAPLFGFLALRFSSEGIGWTRPIMLTAVIALLAKIPLNALLIHGGLGVPPLGAVGCGVATAIVDWTVFVVMVLYVRAHRIYRPYAPFACFERPLAVMQREILALGLPIGGSVLAEGALFASAALIVGGLGSTVMAAHAIAINYASLMFMVPLSLHSATTIHVGHRLGARAWAAGRLAGWVGITMCVAMMALSALVLCFARPAVAALYSRDADVTQLAARLLLFAAIFQVADGLQVGSAGALRGFKDAAVPMAICLVSYWGVGFPLAWYAGVHRAGGVEAIWMGLLAGLFVCAALLVSRYAWITGQRRCVTAPD
jgi:MATE family multidrug resistance protein